MRRILRGRPRPGGQRRLFLNLCKGLDKIGQTYRINAFSYVGRHPRQVACIVGKPQVLDVVPWSNPIVFGAAVFSHPIDDPHLLERLPVTKMLVPGEWMRRMCEPFYGDAVVAWPVGIDTDQWLPGDLSAERDVDVLVYDKIRWHRDRYEPEFLEPLVVHLRQRDLRVAILRYGTYREEDFHRLVRRSRSMVFLCEHETQGIAYQQALSAGVPIIAWDRGGPWQDPAYYPDRVQFGPVTSVPYWDDRCGSKFKTVEEFPEQFGGFWQDVEAARFQPREYILENLTLKRCAHRYLEIVRSVQPNYTVHPFRRAGPH